MKLSRTLALATDQCAELTYAGAMDFKDGIDKQEEYLWDANGNMTRDRNKGIYEIRYNVLNLPERIENEYGFWADSCYHYRIADYQGNMRAVISQNGVLEEVNAYYPYGGLLGAPATGVQKR